MQKQNDTIDAMASTLGRYTSANALCLAILIKLLISKGILTSEEIADALDDHAAVIEPFVGSFNDVATDDEFADGAEARCI